MIHTFKINPDIEDQLKEFNAKLPADQKVVNMVTSGDYLFLTVEKKEPSLRSDWIKGGGTRLLQEHLKRGQ